MVGEPFTGFSTKKNGLTSEYNNQPQQKHTKKRSVDCSRGQTHAYTKRSILKSLDGGGLETTQYVQCLHSCSLPALGWSLGEGGRGEGAGWRVIHEGLLENVGIRTGCSRWRVIFKTLVTWVHTGFGWRGVDRRGHILKELQVCPEVP